MKLLHALLLCSLTFGITNGQNDPGTTPKPGTIPLNPKDVEAGKILISQSDCKTCHLIDYTLIGPGYKEIAQRYPLTDYGNFYQHKYRAVIISIL